ncbi:hypothetical protein ACLOAV_010001 [Pseudogymnoascus australis]
MPTTVDPANLSNQWRSRKDQMAHCSCCHSILYTSSQLFEYRYSTQFQICHKYDTGSHTLQTLPRCKPKPLLFLKEAWKRSAFVQHPHIVEAITWKRGAFPIDVQRPNILWAITWQSLAMEVDRVIPTIWRAAEHTYPLAYATERLHMIDPITHVSSTLVLGQSIWYDNSGDSSCKDIRDSLGVKPETFTRWNPSITLDCGNWQIYTSYCTWVESESPTTSTTTNTSTTSPTPTAKPSPSSWESLGCWPIGATGFPSLDKHISDIPANTPAKCQDACYKVADTNYRFAGVAAGSQCWCSDFVRNDVSVNGTADCNAPCSGDATKTCGGGKFVNVYEADFSVQPPVSLSSPNPATVTSSTEAVTSASSTTAVSSASSTKAVSSVTSSKATSTADV